MTNASLGLSDIQRIDDDDVEEEEKYGRCESPVLSKIFHRSQRSIKEMTPDDPELVEAARKAVIPLPATPQPLTGHDLTATVPVDQSAVNPSFSLESNLMPSTAKIPESLCDLLNFENTSWTSSLATPHGRNVTYSNLNTEEKKVLVSNNPVPRSLFTPEVKEDQSQKSLNESFMECSGILPSVEPKKLCKAYEEFCTSDIFSSNDASQNTTVLTGIEKISDVSLGCSTSAKEPHLVREVLDLLVSPVTTSRQKTYSKVESLSETPLHHSNYKYVHEFGKVCKLRPKAKRLFRKGNEPYYDRESDTTVNGDQINNDNDGPTVNISKEQPVSPNLSGTFIFASPISPVLKAKADEKQQKSGVLSCSPVLHRTQEFLHDFSFSTLEEVCQASEVLASGCASPVENCEISNNFLAQNIESCGTQNVSPIQFQDIACHSSRLVVNKTSTPIHTERSKKTCANKKKIKFLNIHQGQKVASSVKEHKEKVDFLCKPQVASQKSDVVEQNSKYDNDLMQHSNTLINKNNFVGLNNVVPDSTDSLRHRVVSVKSNAKQKNKFAYISELGTCNTVNITRFPSVDTILNNMLQSAEALEAVSLLQNENFSSSLKKHLEQMCRTETDFVPFNKLSLVSTGQQSIAGNFVKKNNVSEESKNNLDNALHKTMGDHSITSGRKRKSGSHGIPRDQCLPKRTCKELKSVQVPEVFKRPDSNNLQSYVSDTQMNVVFDNVDAIVAEFNSKVDIHRTVVGSCNTSSLSNFHTENKCPTSLLENINVFPSENSVNKDDIRTEGNNLSSRKNRTVFCNMDKNEIDQLENPIELKTQNNYSLKHKLPDSETSCDSSRNLDNKFRKELDASDNISLDIGSTKIVNITQQFEGKQIIPKECLSEEPVTEEYNETSFLNSHQHIFDSSFTAVTQKATELVGKEQTKEEGLLGCEQSNTVECNITDETKAESSHVIGSAQNILEDINEDSADKDAAAEHTPCTEFNKEESSHLCIDSESSNISENESSKQQSHMTNMRQVFQKKYDSIISPPICKSGSHSSKIKMKCNPVNEDFVESCKSLVFNHDKLYEIIHCSDKCLQAQPNVVVSSADNAEKELCAQGNILGVKVSEGTDPEMFFTTAKGKKIEMSKRCLDLACNLFSDIIEPNIEQFDGQDVYTTQKKGVTNTVTINKGDLTKNNDTKNCKEKYEKNDNSDVQYSRMESLNLINMTATDAVPLPVGFSTASGKTLTFSKKSLHKARHILQSVIDLETSRDSTLHDFNLSSMRDTNTPSISNINLQRCTALPENTMPLPEQFFQNKVTNVADASSNGKTLQLARMPESVRVSQTKLSGHRDTCVTAESHSSTLQKQLDKTKKLSVEFKTNNSTDNMDNDEQKQRNILAQEIKSSESLLKIDSATADKIETDVKSKKVESGFTTAAGGRLFILGKGLHKAKKIFSDILSQHPSESKDCNTGIGSSAETASEGNREPDNSMFTDKGPLPKTSSYKTVQAMLDTEDSNDLLNSDCETLCAANLLTGSCTLTESVLEDTKTKFESTFVTPAESDTTSPQKLIGLEDTCHSNQTEIANTEICKGLKNESNLNRGFMTAAGRNIIVSTASLDRAKRLMSDISVMNEDDCKNIVSQVKRKDLKDSLMPQQKHKHNMLEKEQIKKVNTVLLAEHMEEWKTSTMGHNLTESLNKLTTPETVEPTDLKAKKCPENISAVPEQVVNSQFSCGFQTAAGKPLEISLASRSKVEQMFDDIMIPVIKERDCTVTSQLKKSLQNAENISTTFERNVNVHYKFMKTLDTINVMERKPGTSSSPEKNHTFSFVTADGRDVEISQLSFQEVKETNEIGTGEMCSPKKIYGTSLDKVKKTLFNKTTLIEQTCNIESGSEIKTLNKKENSAHTKISQMGGGFITPGGKSVDVSEESLTRVRNLFSDITENFEETTLTEGNMKETEAIEGSSSNGKEVMPHSKMKNSSQDRAIEIKKIFSTESENEVQICHNKKNSMDCKRVNVCGGFLTAGGKKVDVSEESLLKVRNLFSDITETVEKPTMTAENMKGKYPTELYTCKRREIISPEKEKNLSSDSAVEMEKVFNTTLIEQTCNIESGSEIETLNKKQNSAHTKISQMGGGFITAGGKSVDVSEESLMRVRNLFSDITENFEETTLTEGDMKEKEAIEGSSSNGKKVIPHGKMKNSSQDRAIEMKKIFSTESENEVQICHNNKKSMDCKRVNVCGGFVTAGGKKVDVSEESLLKVRNLFSDITETVEKPTMTAGNMKGKDPTEIYTCKRREIISPEKVKSLSSDRTVEMEKVCNTESQNEVEILDKKESSVNCQRWNMSFGFTTAGGKKINVSEESLARVKNLFSDTTENSENKTLNVDNIKLKEVPEVYSTEKKDIISVEKVCSLPPNRSTRTRNMSDGEFQNEVKLLEKKENSVNCGRLNMCGGFVTAGGRNVGVSEESLLKVRNLFSDITETVEKPTMTAENMKGKDPAEMYTCKRREIISPEKVKNLSSDRTVEMEKVSNTESQNEVQILDEKKNSVNCQRQNMSFGFTTAGGKKINVSEESLARVKNLFSDTTENSENNTSNVENMKLKEVPEVYSTEKKDIISVEKMCSLPPNRSTRTRKMSDGEFQNEVKLLGKKENSVNCGRLNMYGGFVTAGGRNVGVSEASLARVRNLFSDITENVEETTFNLRNAKEKEATVMNCLNKKDILPLEKVKSSSSGTRKIAETRFENEVHMLDKEENSLGCKKLNTFGGFVTAGGKKMEVSEESLATVRNLFSDITEKFEENTLTAENTKENEAAEWQCLKKKDVLALETVEKPLSDRTIGNKKMSGSESENEVKLVDKKQNVVDSKRRKIYGGFVTGCGKKVEVSEESLAKVRSIFSDMTGSEENSPVVVRNVDSSPSYVEKSCIAATDCELNEFSLGTETHRYTPYQESADKRSKETSISDLDMKNYVSGTTASNKPYDNAIVENVLHHNTKINATSKQRVQRNEPTLTQEVSESTAALLLDDDFKKELEESDSSCFSMLTERSCSPDLSVTMGSATSIGREPGSPVIGSKNKCSRSNKVLVRRSTTAKKAERITALAKNACDQSTFEDKNNTPSIPEGNGRRKRCNSIQDNQMHKKQCMSNVGLNENVGEPPAAKMKAHVIPSPGSWLQLRISAQKQCVQWRDISHGNPPSQFSELELLQFGVKKSVINVTSKTAEYFKFSASDFYRDGNDQFLQGGDDTSLEFDADGFAGVQEVEQAFLTSPNVDKSLIPTGWIQNHYRWIVWKLAATERSFPHIFASRYLTPRVLLLQLKYRYDREIDRCQRPALRRIMEHDDAPGKRMVLCVADIIKQEETQEENVKEGSRQSLKMCNYELELTDGWYKIRSTVDKEMCHLIEAGRVAVGTKLVTHSAELVNCEQPCPPLEAGPNVRLKIHTNSTRRARWDCRLGYCRQPGPLPVSLSSLKPAGGVISCVAAVIARVYPIVYMEKGSDGKAEFYSAKQEALRASKRERQWQEHIEKLYSQERGELSQFEWFGACSQQSKPKGTSKKHVTTPTRQQLSAATCVEDLWQLLCNAPDPTSLQSLLTEEQRDAVANYQQMRQQQLLQELEARVRKRIEEERNGTSSVALLKLGSVALGQDRPHKNSIHAQAVEKCVKLVTDTLYKVCGQEARDGYTQVRCLDAKDCSARSAVLSIWRPSEDLLTLFQEGSVLKLFSITANGLRNGDLQLSACRQSRYQPQPCQPPNDFPARCVTPLSHVSSGNLQASFGELDCVGVVVHVAPLSGNYQTVYLADADMDIVGISFWNGVKASGWEDILKQKALVACSNLQSRVGAAVHWIPTTYATEFSVFSQHPRQKHLVEALESLRRNLNMDIENFSYTCEGIVLSFLNEQIVTPVRNASLNVRQTKPSTAELSRLNTPGVTPELSEKVQRRLFKLEKYGEPPSLSPLALIPRSRVLKKRFHVPLKTDETADSSCDDSPPMSLDSDDT